jgi:hypothetical protein
MGTDAIVLDDAAMEGPPKDFSVHGLSIPADSHSLLVCDGDGMKSLTMLLVLGEMAKRGIPVAYLDWEWNAARHKRRKERLSGPIELINCSITAAAIRSSSNRTTSAGFATVGGAQMGTDIALDAERGLQWLVDARNNSQSLMLRLLQRWDHLDANKRRVALGAAFSLWRAVFLLVKRGQDEPPIDMVDKAAKQFLEKVIRTNAIGFSDDLSNRNRAWSSSYYVENAMYRITALTGHEFGSYSCSPMGTVRDAWNEAYRELDAFVSGTILGTTFHRNSGYDEGRTT